MIKKIQNIVQRTSPGIEMVIILMDGHSIRIDFGFNYSRISTNSHVIFSCQARDLLMVTSSQWPVKSRFPTQKKDNMAGSGENHSIETSASSKKKKNSERLWTDEEPEQLITSYEGKKCLWDFTCKEYSERDQKPLAFNSIDEKMSQVQSLEEPIYERSCITTITTLISTSPCCDRH